MKSKSKVELSQVRVYSRLMTEMKVLAASKNWTIVETASVLIAEALAARNKNMGKVNDIIKANRT